MKSDTLRINAYAVKSSRTHAGRVPPPTEESHQKQPTVNSCALAVGDNECSRAVTVGCIRYSTPPGTIFEA